MSGKVAAKSAQSSAKGAKKKEKPKSKPVAQEVIDLEADQQERGASPSELFMSDLARKCNSFFSWLGDPQSIILAEHLWKQSMMGQASSRFPQLSYVEIGRLVERDWKYMPEQERQRIAAGLMGCPSAEEVSRRVSSWSVQS